MSQNMTIMSHKSAPASYHGAPGGSRPVLVRGEGDAECAALYYYALRRDAEDDGERGGARVHAYTVASLACSHDADLPCVLGSQLSCDVPRSWSGAEHGMQTKPIPCTRLSPLDPPAIPREPRPNPLNEVALCSSRARAFPAPGSSPTSLPPFQTVAPLLS